MSKVSLAEMLGINLQPGSQDSPIPSSASSENASDGVVFYAEKPSKNEVLDAHEDLVIEDSPSIIELVDSSDGIKEVQADESGTELVITIEIPGVTELDPEKEKLLEVCEEDLDNKEESSDDKKARWNWSQSHGLEKFVDWAREMYKNVPKHSGYSVPGLERAVAYVQALLNEISKAMRSDIDGVLDANTIEEVREEIDKGFQLLQDRIEKVNKSKKKKKASYEFGFVKEAQKALGVKGIYISVPLLISRVARVCINGMVSGGKDIEDLFHRQVKKFKLNDREQAEVMQCLADMGYALRTDRGYLIDDPEDDGTGANGYDFTENYPG